MHDVDSDGQVSIDEVAPEYWKSIASFDRNQDGSVDIEEHRDGVRELTREKSVRFFSAMDADANGLVSEQEAPSTLWPKWIPFDSDNDSKLNQEEFVRSQLDSTTLQ